jgi:hypothetical protein
MISYICITILGAIMSSAIFHCMYVNRKTIHYLVIKNQWIWWINKLIYIWSYPKEGSKVFFGKV